jgi:D-sedoheptulose 7-phosphate isomerase
MIEDIKKEVNDHIEVANALGDSDFLLIAEMARLCVSSIQSGGKIVFCGNGGSAADAQHLSAELVVRYRKKRKALPGLALSTDVSSITACGNDFSFDEIFSRQVEALVNQEDVLIAISTSGNSPNVVKAIEAMQAKGGKVVGITGDNDSQLVAMSDLVLKMPSKNTARIQEMYFLVGHILCGLIEDNL